MAITLRLRLLNLCLRLFLKTRLGAMKRPEQMREGFERGAAQFFRAPDGANFVADKIRRPGEGTGGDSMIDALWASRGRPDRRRLILYLHGGAYIAGSIRTHRHLAAWLAGAAAARVVLPEYRLAPEHPFPAGLEDALCVYRHLLESGYAPGNIALAGDSAGGGMVFALLLKIAAEGLPRPACAVAFSPWTDLTLSHGSLARNARREVMLPVRRFPEVVAEYLQGAASTDPFASPVRGSFENPPPALILASKSEALRDDAVAMAERLREAGGDVTLELWKDTPHAWPVFVGLVREAEVTVTRSGAFIARHLGDRSAG